ncbi:adenosylcobinamide-GDP ribazoletransferase [Methylobacterium sp. sgz302541]|uniref:adenosylcobinamide-GDP ribazoletransferase n=1 Tax=unclassified Methylobacterium TaxID=2615210 RepID=UPI003D337689
MRDEGGLSEEADWPGRDLVRDLAACLRFYSRLPVPRFLGEPDPYAVPDFRTVPRMLPVAGLLLALPSALTLLAARGLGPFLAASLAILVGILVTGALHEDGLADCADGLGGSSRQRALEIMRDSRIGSYGGLALAFSLLLRIGALATLLDRIGGAAAVALLLAAVLSRTFALAPMVLLRPARPDGAGASVGRPEKATVGVAAGLALALALLALLVLPVRGVSAMLVPALAGALAVTWLAKRRFGGQTGDVVGASQQAAEIAALLGLLAVV